MEKRIYTCATAHLDTVWNWDFERSVSICLYNTLVKNFRLFEKYPDYNFNFEGAYRYELFEEYYPELFEKLKEYVAKGRWNVTGSAYENGDVNVPSPEALFRNILYGNEYFDKAFGKRSKDIYLPDCFGFGWALPSIISHANLMGFTTQKLTWGSAYGMPFDIGRWYGVNGKSCFACTNPGEYVASYSKIRKMPFLENKLRENESKYGLPWTFSFHGTGDQGGSPKEKSVAVLADEMAKNGSEDVKVISSAGDEIYYDLAALSQEQKDRLPTWKNELVMTDHAVGGYTARAIGKRWNRRVEEIADITERSSVTAQWLGAKEYPKKSIDKSWKRAIAHQFHDDLPGTSLQRVYQRSWNDYVLSMNQLENEYTDSVGAVASMLDTSWVSGTAIVVHNCLETARKDYVSCIADIGNSKCVKIFDKDGNAVPCQISKRIRSGSVIGFVPEMPAMGYKVFDLIFSNDEPEQTSELKLTEKSLENQKYIVSLNDNGDIAGIYDKNLQKELLKEPIVFDILQCNGSKMWPAWELDYKEVSAPPKGKAVKREIEVVRNGNASIALKITQTYENTRLKTTVSLDNGGERVNCQCEIRWKSLTTMLKNRFSLNTENEKASFDLGLGVIERTNAKKNLYEVPAQKWADISGKEFGVSIISDSKYGWDKPNDNTLRLTAVYTPFKHFLRGNKGSMQGMMDLGLNRYGYAIYSHSEKWGDSTQRNAREFNQPMSSFITEKHEGVLGAEFSMAQISNSGVIVRCIKKAENSDDIVVRFNEGVNAKATGVKFKLGDGIESAKEIYASEEFIGDAVTENGHLVFDIEPYDVKSFMLKLKKAEVTAHSGVSQKQIKLGKGFNAFVSRNKTAPQVLECDAPLFPAELAPKQIDYCSIKFDIDTDSAIRANGQEIQLDGKYGKVYFLAASLSNDKAQAEFITNGVSHKRFIPCVDGRIGKWDLYSANETADIKECRLAYEFTHARTKDGADVVAHQMYLFCIEVPLNGGESVKLPKDSDIIILSATAVKGEKNFTLGYPLYDREQSRAVHLDFTNNDKATHRRSMRFYNAASRVHLVKRDKGL